MNMDLDTLHELYSRELCEIQCFEKAQLEILPNVIRQVHDRELIKVLEEHLEQTREHSRLVDTFQTPLSKDTTECSASKTLLVECLRISDDDEAQPEVRDAAIIAAVQKIEHLEMAMYGSTGSHAEDLGYTEVVAAISKIIEEEGMVDRQLSRIALSSVNFKAVDQ